MAGGTAGTGEAGFTTVVTKTLCKNPLGKPSEGKTQTQISETKLLVQDDPYPEVKEILYI